MHKIRAEFLLGCVGNGNARGQKDLPDFSPLPYNPLSIAKQNVTECKFIVSKSK